MPEVERSKNVIVEKTGVDANDSRGEVDGGEWMVDGEPQKREKDINDKLLFTRV